MTSDEGESAAPAEEKRQDRLRVLDLSAVGLAFPIALLLGYFGGRLIGGWLGSAQIGGLVGALVGIAGGFYNLLKMVSRLAPRSAAVTSPSTTAPGERPGPAGAVVASHDDDELLDEGTLDADELDDLDDFDDDGDGEPRDER